jgi:anti-anti-sigma factor
LESASRTLNRTPLPAAYDAGSASATTAGQTAGPARELRFEVRGSLDRRSASNFVESLRSLELSRPGRITIDLRGCDFLDVVGACVLLDAARRARRDGRRLALAGASPLVLRMLQLTSVDRVVELQPAMSEAPG